MSRELAPGLLDFLPSSRVIHGEFHWRAIPLIEKLFSSPAMYRVLALFAEYPEETLNPRLISRYTGVDIKGVVRELRKLEKTGIIRGWSAGAFRFYHLDPDHPAHDSLRSLFLDTKAIRNFRFRVPAFRVWENMTG